MGQTRHPPQMLRHTAKLLLDHRQPFEAMAHGQLVGHAHAAVQLHRALAHQAGRTQHRHMGR